MIEDLQKTLQPISNFFYIITHPRVILDWFIDISYWLAVLISVIALIFYVSTKSQKSKQIFSGTIIAYIILQAIVSVI